MFRKWDAIRERRCLFLSKKEQTSQLRFNGVDIKLLFICTIRYDIVYSRVVMRIKKSKRAFWDTYKRGKPISFPLSPKRVRNVCDFNPLEELECSDFKWKPIPLKRQRQAKLLSDTYKVQQWNDVSNKVMKSNCRHSKRFDSSIASKLKPSACSLDTKAIQITLFSGCCH